MRSSIVRDSSSRPRCKHILGFDFAELNPDLRWGLNSFAGQLESWGLPEGTVALFRYDTMTQVINPSYFLF